MIQNIKMFQLLQTRILKIKASELLIVNSQQISELNILLQTVRGRGEKENHIRLVKILNLGEPNCKEGEKE